MHDDFILAIIDICLGSDANLEDAEACWAAQVMYKMYEVLWSMCFQRLVLNLSMSTCNEDFDRI